jgi:ribosomal-protein-alanine N-acetyltransferase
MGFGAMSLEEPALRGRTVTLRPLTDSDLDQWREVWERNSEHLRETGASSPGAGTAEADFQSTLEMYHAASDQGLAYQFGIFKDDRFVGEATIDGIVGGTLATGMVGVWIDEQEAGHGTGADAFVVLCRLAFEEIGLHRLESAALPDNEAVRSAFARLGIRDEGVASRYRLVDGEWRDHVRYAITAEEWQERRDELMAGGG